MVGQMLWLDKHCVRQMSVALTSSVGQMSVGQNWRHPRIRSNIFSFDLGSKQQEMNFQRKIFLKSTKLSFCAPISFTKMFYKKAKSDS
jgi:hypothetical protein